MEYEFDIKVISGNKLITIHCFPTQDESDASVFYIHLYCYQDILQKFQVTPTSYLILKLSADGEYVLKVKTSEAFIQKIVFNKLQEEFGKGYEIIIGSEYRKKSIIKKLFSKYFSRPIIEHYDHHSEMD